MAETGPENGPAVLLDFGNRREIDRVKRRVGTSFKRGRPDSDRGNIFDENAAALITEDLLGFHEKPCLHVFVGCRGGFLILGVKGI